jgi:pimeloyl-ACP methyl ester carboxylesterase
MEHTTIKANGLEFAYFEDGPADGPLALCLHGFPDTAHTWRYLLPELAAAGFHAVAPFLRGYAPTQIAPDGRYQIGAIAQDAEALHGALGGGEDAVIIGHDWGALAIGMSLFGYPQLHASWYMFFFLSPFAEMALPLDDYSFIDGLWADWSPGYDGNWDIAKVKESIGDAEHMLAAVSYYRAMYNTELHAPELADEQAASFLPTPKPTLYLHGENDGCMLTSSIGAPLDFMAEGSEMEMVANAGHFLHLEQPESVNRRIVEFLGR